MNFLSITLFKQTFGPSINAISVTPKGAQPASAGVFSPLSIPIRSLQDNTQVFSLLSWHTRVSDFAGREMEMAALEDWAQNGQAVSIKFLIASGGAGKSRLAAEFALGLQEREWEAGFLDVRKAANFRLGKKGTLLIVDYPEEHREGVGALLSDLARLDEEYHIRVLFLTRAEIDGWIDFVSLQGAQDLTDFMPVRLGPLSASDGAAIINSAMDKVAQREGASPYGFCEDIVQAWMRHLPENQLPLFLVATGVFAALYPQEAIASYSGPEIIAALAERERLRLRKISFDQGAKEETLPRLLAVATMAGGLPVDEVRAWGADTRTLFGFPDDWDPVKILRQSGAAVGGKILPLRPDIVAAAFAADVLEEETANAPELIWLAVRNDPQAALPTLSRMEYDASKVLGRDFRFGEMLARAVEGKEERCKSCEGAVSRLLPSNLATFGVAVWGTLNECSVGVRYKTKVRNNLSVCLYEAGDVTGSLLVIKDNIDELRNCVENTTEEFKTEFAGSLNNFSNRLHDIGNHPEALATICEATEIIIGLKDNSQCSIAAVLALSLDNLSNRLSEDGALLEIISTVDLVRRKSVINHKMFELNRVNNLDNLFIRLSTMDEDSATLAAICEVASVFRCVMSQRANEITPRKNEDLRDLSRRLSLKGAFVASYKATDVFRNLVKQNPEEYYPGLARSLHNHSHRLFAADKVPDALNVIQEAVEIRRRLVSVSPAQYEPDLASSLNSLSGRFLAVGDFPNAYGAIRDALKIYFRLAVANSDRFTPELARVLGAAGHILLIMGKAVEAAETFRNGADLVRPYARKLPGSPMEQLLHNLEADYQHAQDALDAQAPKA